MKLYLNLLSIFFCIFAFTNLAIAHTPEIEVLETETEEEILEQSAEEELEEDAIAESDETIDAITDEDLQPQDGEIAETNNVIFVQCPATELVTDSEVNSEINPENPENPENPDDALVTASETNPEINPEINPENPGNIENPDPYTPDCLTPEEVIHYQKLVIADNLFKTGDKLTAAQIYQEEKTPWEQEFDRSNIIPEANYDPAKLSPGGAVYWRIYQEGKEQGLKSKILTPLELLVEKEPQFIPGHLSYAEALLAYEKEEESLIVLERAIGFYPQDVELLRAKVASNVRNKQWIEASISSRQFALFNPDVPEAGEFTVLADEYLEAFKDQVRGELTFNAIGNAITGAVGFAFTGNIFGPISAIDTTVLLLQGESNLGEKFANRAQKQLPMVENEAILNYVREVGQKVAAVAGRDEFEFEFYVIMDDNINAFALPGGKIFVNLGVILNTDSEAELAGLLAHEAAHSVLSHGFQLVTSGSLTANITQYVPYVGGTAGNLIVLNYSREMEKQADLFGTRMLVASDYAADGVRNLMAHLEELHEEDEDRREPPVWLSTHPNTSERVRYMEEFIVENNLNRYNYEGVERHYQMKQLAKKIWHEYKAEWELDY